MRINYGISLQTAGYESIVVFSNETEEYLSHKFFLNQQFLTVFKIITFEN